MKKTKRGLIVGRFQPFHTGHQSAIKNILKEVDELVIVIGSTQKSFTNENPFTTGERVEMIAKSLQSDKLYEKCHIVPLSDVGENALWTKKVKSYCPSFEVIYTNNPLVRQLFESENMEVKKMVSNLKDIESVHIRKMMIEGGEWEKYVPKETGEYLKEIKAVERLKAIIEKEQKQ